MLVENTEFIGRQVYTPEGRLLGEISNVVIDIEGSKIDGLFIVDPNPVLVEDSRPVNVPYRWVSAVNDVVLLKYFPKRVSMKKAPRESAPAREEEPPVAR